MRRIRTPKKKTYTNNKNINKKKNKKNMNKKNNKNEEEE